MNAIVSFRLCSLTDQELLEKVDQMTDQMYKDGKIPDRHIPAQPNNDYDLLIGEMVKRFYDIINSSENPDSSLTASGQTKIV